MANHAIQPIAARWAAPVDFFVRSIDEGLEGQPMIYVDGRVQKGLGHFTIRMDRFEEVFTRATGEKLFRGTLNLNVGASIPPREHFRIKGKDIGEPDQDLLFEVCRVSGIWAYRVRPYHLPTGRGGHGDDVLEIVSSTEIPNATEGSIHKIALFRETR